MSAMRPKKDRFVGGVKLAENLYPDPKKRPGFYQYHRPDGTKKTFTAPTPEAANVLADDANARRGSYEARDKPVPTRDTLMFHVDRYIVYEERINPSLKGKESWTNRCYALRKFAKEFPYLRDVEQARIRVWWDGLGHHQQKLRHAAFRRFFNWLMHDGLLPKLKLNPFNTSDEAPRLYAKERPKKVRRPLSQEQYAKIHARAPGMGYEALQIAMGISRYTTLREGDICGLRWDANIVGGQLRVIVSKSEAQKGTARATRLCWTLTEHPVLKKLIDRAREVSLVNKRCPFVISHKPIKRIRSERKEHFYQVLPERLCRMFREVMRDCNIEGTSFHEVRGLSSTLYKRAGYTDPQIQAVMAHESIRTTQAYQNAEDLPYAEVVLCLPA